METNFNSYWSRLLILGDINGSNYNGKHDGWGTFGEPTGASVFVLGASHSEFGPNGLRREYCLFDYVSIWKQILIHTGAVY